MSRNGGVGDDGAFALATMLRDVALLPSLRKLAVFGTGLGCEGYAALRAAVAPAAGFEGHRRSSVEMVGLECERFDDALLVALRSGNGAARRVARVLASSDDVEALNLYGADIGAEGAAAIAQALRAERGALPALRELRMGRNCIGVEGTLALTSALRAMPGTLPLLERLWLCDNEDVGGDGAVAFLDALRDGPGMLPSLELVSLGGGGATMSRAIVRVAVEGSRPRKWQPLPATTPSFARDAVLEESAACDWMPRREQDGDAAAGVEVRSTPSRRTKTSAALKGGARAVLRALTTGVVGATSSPRMLLRRATKATAGFA